MSGSPRILFFPAFSPTIGGGHLFRCMTLAQALTAKGARCALAAPAAGIAAISQFGPAAVELIERGSSPVETTAALFGAQAVVFDDYQVGADVELPLALGGVLVAVIDDLADRPHQCALLVDPGYGRRRSDYTDLVPRETELLLGPSYALLRPQFAARRPAALRRRIDSAGRSVLVSLGLTDVGGVTGKVAALLDGVATLQVVLGSGASSLPQVRGMKGVKLHVDTSDMAEVISACDVGVGAGGVGTWERACLGLPSILLVLADNQAAMAARLAEDGVVIALDARQDGFEQHVVAGLERLFSDHELRASLTQRSAHLCDGLGAERVAEALLAKLP